MYPSVKPRTFYLSILVEIFVKLIKTHFDLDLAQGHSHSNKPEFLSLSGAGLQKPILKIT